MLPVWDFSVPDLDQLQAEQADLIWNPLPDVTDADIHATLGLSSISSRSAFRPESLGLLPARSNSQPGDECLWDQGASMLRSEKGNGSQRQSSLDLSRHDDLQPTPSPLDTSTAQEEVEEASQRQRTGSSDSSERSKAVNRESQRRFRLRQKVMQTPEALCSRYAMYTQVGNIFSKAECQLQLL